MLTSQIQWCVKEILHPNKLNFSYGVCLHDELLQQSPPLYLQRICSKNPNECLKSQMILNLFSYLFPHICTSGKV